MGSGLGFGRLSLGFGAFDGLGWGSLVIVAVFDEKFKANMWICVS